MVAINIFFIHMDMNINVSNFNSIPINKVFIKNLKDSFIKPVKYFLLAQIN